MDVPNIDRSKIFLVATIVAAATAVVIIMLDSRSRIFTPVALAAIASFFLYLYYRKPTEKSSITSNGLSSEESKQYDIVDEIVAFNNKLQSIDKFCEQVKNSDIEILDSDDRSVSEKYGKLTSLLLVDFCNSYLAIDTMRSFTSPAGEVVFTLVARLTDEQRDNVDNLKSLIEQLGLIPLESEWHFLVAEMLRTHNKSLLVDYLDLHLRFCRQVGNSFFMTNVHKSYINWLKQLINKAKDLN